MNIKIVLLILMLCAGRISPAQNLAKQVDKLAAKIERNITTGRDFKKESDGQRTPTWTD